ncbi:ATP-binding cassette domain-containing protein [Bacillus sp. JJ1562]|uniref:ATP-binding cassette domain-containing protein n=1 Tax=Bacillus sp. JJ1562 TaxID=3122960 RepID=UPI003002A5AC
MRIFEANKACKKIDGIMILNDVSITISQGEKIAITGSNGSGKSSLLKLIGGIFKETSGEINRTKLNIGYVPERFPENIRFTLKEYLLIIGKMTSNSDEDIRKRIEYYTKLFTISDFLTTPLNNCSKGTKQKAGIIQALLKEPDLLLLDEPLTGLDEKAKNELLNQLNSLQTEKTIIFTAHESLLIEGLADRVLSIESGRVVYDSIVIKKEKLKAIKAKIPNREILVGIPYVRHEFAEENFVEIIVSVNKSDEALAMLLERGCSIFELTEKR